MRQEIVVITLVFIFYSHLNAASKTNCLTKKDITDLQAIVTDKFKLQFFSEQTIDEINAVLRLKSNDEQKSITRLQLLKAGNALIAKTANISQIKIQHSAMHTMHMITGFIFALHPQVKPEETEDNTKLLRDTTDNCLKMVEYFIALKDVLVDTLSNEESLDDEKFTFINSIVNRFTQHRLAAYEQLEQLTKLSKIDNIKFLIDNILSYEDSLREAMSNPFGILAPEVPRLRQYLEARMLKLQDIGGSLGLSMLEQERKEHQLTRKQDILDTTKIDEHLHRKAIDKDYHLKFSHDDKQDEMLTNRIYEAIIKEPVDSEYLIALLKDIRLRLLEAMSMYSRVHETVLAIFDDQNIAKIIVDPIGESSYLMLMEVQNIIEHYSQHSGESKLRLKKIEDTYAENPKLRFSSLLVWVKNEAQRLVVDAINLSLEHLDPRQQVILEQEDWAQDYVQQSFQEAMTSIRQKELQLTTNVDRLKHQMSHYFSDGAQVFKSHLSCLEQEAKQRILKTIYNISENDEGHDYSGKSEKTPFDEQIIDGLVEIAILRHSNHNEKKAIADKIRKKRKRQELHSHMQLFDTERLVEDFKKHVTDSFDIDNAVLHHSNIAYDIIGEFILQLSHDDGDKKLDCIPEILYADYKQLKDFTNEMSVVRSVFIAFNYYVSLLKQEGLALSDAQRAEFVTQVLLGELKDISVDNIIERAVVLFLRYVPHKMTITALKKLFLAAINRSDLQKIASNRLHVQIKHYFKKGMMLPNNAFSSPWWQQFIVKSLDKILPIIHHCVAVHGERIHRMSGSFLLADTLLSLDANALDIDASSGKYAALTREEKEALSLLKQRVSKLSYIMQQLTVIRLSIENVKNLHSLQPETFATQKMILPQMISIAEIVALIDNFDLRNKIIDPNMAIEQLLMISKEMFFMLTSRHKIRFFDVSHDTLKIINLFTRCGIKLPERLNELSLVNYTQKDVDRMISLPLHKNKGYHHMYNYIMNIVVNAAKYNTDNVPTEANTISSLFSAEMLQLVKDFKHWGHNLQKRVQSVTKDMSPYYLKIPMKTGYNLFSHS